MAPPPAHLQTTSLLLLGLLSFLHQTSPSLSLLCSSQKFSNNRLYQKCTDLPRLGAFLHWTFSAANSSLSVAFSAQPAKPVGWVAWALNPSGTGMVGAQALIAFRDDAAAAAAAGGSVVVKTYSLVSYKMIKEGDISYNVSETAAEYDGGVMRIFATVALPATTTAVNQVWQVGGAVVNGTPAMHEFKPANLNAKGRLDLLRGDSSSGSSSDGGGSELRDKNIHGVLNAMSWGIMIPMGIIVARYFRMFVWAQPAWFYAHVGCQTMAYAIGVTGWATGLKLGNQSKGIQYTAHRNIGIALFTLATLQIFALFLRPKKEHKSRYYWNIYHHGVGYVVLVLGIVNVFKGLGMLQPPKKWKSAYISVLGTLGCVALVLEIGTWIVVLKRRSAEAAKPYDDGGLNGRQESPSEPS